MISPTAPHRRMGSPRLPTNSINRYGRTSNQSRRSFSTGHRAGSLSCVRPSSKGRIRFMSISGEAHDARARFANSLLGRLSTAPREALLHLGIKRVAGPSESIIRQGELEAHVILLHDAVVKVTALTADGKQALLAIRVTGDLVGEISALNGTPRSASVVTCRRTVFSIIQRTEFRRFLKDHPDAAVEIAGVVADRLRWANNRRIDFMSYPIKVRLARILADLVANYGVRVPDGIRVDVQLTQPELASLCGAAEVTVQKALRELREAHVIGTGYREILVQDLPALRRTADIDEPDADAVPAPRLTQLP
jgi:CRP/FNR family transcriptional regulator, cyclic AMP receptor protein